MKARITLTLDPHISHQAKRLAREKGTSLSGWVESLLRESLQESPEPPESFAVDRWRGKFSLTENRDQRAQQLIKRYDLENT